MSRHLLGEINPEDDQYCVMLNEENASNKSSQLRQTKNEKTQIAEELDNTPQRTSALAKQLEIIKKNYEAVSESSRPRMND